MSSKTDVNRVCALLTKVNVDYKQHHRVSINEAHYSKVHLGFSDEAWMQLLKNYILTKTDIKVDFSKCYQYQIMFDDKVPRVTIKTELSIQAGDCDVFTDPYKDMYTNLETYHHNLVDIECALRDFLEEIDCQLVEYRNLTDARINTGITHNRWVYMLREYMHKYHPDIQLNWCEHSSHPYEYCKCEIDQPANIKVDILKMICEHHSNRKW